MSPCKLTEWICNMFGKGKKLQNQDNENDGKDYLMKNNDYLIKNDANLKYGIRSDGRPFIDTSDEETAKSILKKMAELKDFELTDD